MGKPGRTPKIAESRVLEGGPGRRSAVSHRKTGEVVLLAPKIEKHSTPEPPADLPSEGKELWREVMPWLIEMNAVQLIDQPAVKVMCVQYAIAERARRVLDEQGYFVLGSMGQQTEHPALKIYNGATAMFLRYATEFGLTTMARTRLGLMDVQRKSIAQEMDWTLGPSTRRLEG